ncbi:MAG: hypothetical protein J7L07_07870 [Candidatus Odinarchaeota archaeon]|nr:hypothetical protein [Candidatus Odinarchaeota archaeon]
MTERLFLDNAYLFKCSAKVRMLNIREDGKLELILNRTIFHPKGSGQINDIGYIRSDSFEGKVIDVIEEGEDIVHVVEVLRGEAKENDTVECKIDRNRRYAIMRAHTGEHILARAFKKIIPNSEIKGVYLEEDRGYIIVSGISKAEIWSQISRAEEMANKVISEGRKVTVKYYDSLSEAMKHYGNSLRCRLEEFEGINRVRIVEIDKYDYTACSGTHVNNTIEVRFVKITGYEKYDKTSYKLRFSTGEKALKNAIKLSNLLLELSRELSTSEDLVKETVNNLVLKIKDLTKHLKRLSASHVRALIKMQRIVHKDLKMNEIEIEYSDLGDLIKILRDEQIFDDKLLWIFSIRSPKSAIIISGKPIEDLNFESLLRTLQENIKDVGGVKRKEFILLNFKDPNQMSKAILLIKKELEK